MDMMTFSVFRCGTGYLLTRAHMACAVGAEAEVGPLDYVGEFDSARLNRDVHVRVVDEIGRRAYAVISKDELVPAQ